LAAASPSAQVGGEAIRRTACRTMSSAGTTVSLTPARQWLRPAAFVAVAYAGAAVAITLAYRWAANDDYGPAFRAFWIGLLSAVGACVAAQTSKPFLRRFGTASLAGLGFLSYFPMLLRRPDGPVSFDELAHYGQTIRMIDDGRLFEPNIVAMIPDFPGLQTLTVALVGVSGLPVWVVAHVIVCLAHVLALLGIRQLGRGIRMTDLNAHLAAVIYALNPGFLFFTSQFAYESLAIAIQIWALVAMVNLVNAGPGHRARWAAFGLTCGAGVAVTHHLTALVLVFFGLLFVVTTLASSVPRDQKRAVTGLWCATAGMILGWMCARSPGEIANYLLVFPRNGVKQLAELASGRGQSGETSRQAFGATTLPGYELKAAYLAIPLILVLAALGFFVFRSRLTQPTTFPIVLISLLYPASLPFVLTTTGAAGAHRSWPFLWQMLSLLASSGLLALAKGLQRFSQRRTPTVVLAIVPLPILLGTAPVDFYAEARFPGDYVNGVDARMTTPEGVAVGTWLRRHDWAGRNFISADLLSGGMIEAYSGMRFDNSFPTWDVTFYDNAIAPRTVDELGTDDIRILVVDRRVTLSPFRGGVYLNEHEPLAYIRTDPISTEAIRKLETQRWLVKIWSSGNYDVYAVYEPAKSNSGLGVPHGSQR
jgi:hypothetical protein